jgi:hypothetical protein
MNVHLSFSYFLVILKNIYLYTADVFDIFNKKLGSCCTTLLDHFSVFVIYMIFGLYSFPSYA